VPATGSPTVRRRELGVLLRSLRTTAGLTAEQVAGRLGFSPSKLSRLETGRRGASAYDIRRLCDLYQVDDEQRLRLTELAAEGKQRAWWQPLGLPYSTYVGLEAEATSVSDYAPAIVPGLLQTPDYARAVLGAMVPKWRPRVVEERVEGRAARQRLFFSRTAPRFEAVLDESVLHRVVGSPAVMQAQLERLLELSQLPGVTIRVVPCDASAVPSGVNKFIILRFALPDVADVVYIESLTGDLCLDEPAEVAAYSATFRTLASLAADPDATRDVISMKITAYGAQLR
jgi:transcriptional regulator with XRE-family HTH domain